MHRNQDADQVVRNVQENSFGVQNDITNVVKQILAKNGLNVGLHRANYVSPLSEYVLQNKFT